MAARRAEHQAGRHQHRHPHLLVSDDGDGVGVAEAEQLQQGAVVPANHDHPGRGLPREQVLRVRGSLRARRRSLAQHVSRHLLHADGTAWAAHHRRHRGDAVPPWPGRGPLEEKPRAVREPDRVHGTLLALRRPRVDLPVSRAVSALRSARMHSDQEAIKKSIRSYMVVGALLLVFTGATVAANSFHLAVPAAITLALVIASIKGTMVASVFMH